MKKLNYINLFFIMCVLTAITVGLYYAAADWLDQRYFRFLIWNLFLAWLPFVFSSVSYVLAHLKWKAAGWLAAASGLLWLLFFPNAAYIVTDLVHLTVRSGRYVAGGEIHFRYWYDLIVVMMFVWTGLLLGFLSMYQIHELIWKTFGRIMSWIFVLVGCALGSYGILLGRVYRLNSWDVLTNRDMLIELMHESVSRTSLAFCMFFGVFLLSVYVAIYALIHQGRRRENHVLRE